MTECPVLAADGPASISDALRSVDCVSGQAVEVAFGRLFGEHSMLSQALTLTLTLYVALLAVTMLTGRAQLRISMLTPRMLQLGLVLTFATSWVAYQSVGWNLLVGAPDQVAGAILGTQGSATQLFARRLDMLFAIITQTAEAAQSSTGAATTPAPIVPHPSTAPQPADLLWAASLLLLLGTVGVLIVARIALAAVMALGPIFIVFALFKGTRGLFEGWLKAAVMLAITPMLAVLLGGGTMVLIAPMIAQLARVGNKVSLELATSVFLAACVYAALMVLAMRGAGAITAGWRLGQPAPATGDSPDHAAPPATAVSAPSVPVAFAQPNMDGDRMRGIATGINRRSAQADPPASGAAALTDRRTQIVSATPIASTATDTQSGRDPRIRPLGQGFRSPRRGT